MHLDLNDMNSILNFAIKIKKRFKKIDILLNNAGLYCSEREETI